jgi:Tfp pilus assembly protein PilN
MESTSSSTKQKQSTTKNNNSADQLELLIAEVSQLKEQQRKMKQRMTMFVISGYIRLAIVLIPLIIGAIYLVPFLESFADLYLSFFGVDGQMQSNGLLESLGELNSEQIQYIVEQLQTMQ